MRRLLASLTLVTVVLWLMPLGAFIKPAQEKTACDGKRAFHMCSMGEGATAEGYSLKTGFQNPPSEYGAKPSPAAGGSEFLDAARRSALDDKFSFVRTENFSAVYAYFPELSAPPPKTVSSL